MANTLNLGNGNWATKEDSLLAYNSENGNFKPLPFDFTRASSATVVNKDGLIETVGSGEPRIDFSNDAKGALKLEPTRGNLITYSNDFSQWSSGSSLISSNTFISPDGTLNASTLSKSSEYSSIGLSSGSASVGQVYTFSVFVKINTTNYISLRVGGGANDVRKEINLITGVVTDGAAGNQSGFINSNIENFNNDFYRVSITVTGNATTLNCNIYAGEVGNTTNDGLLYIYGAQLEQGSYATSYIPTNGQSGGVTRVADVCNNGGNDQVINSIEGVLYLKTKGFIDVPSDSGYIQLSKNGESSATNSLIIQHRNNGYLRIYVNGFGNNDIHFNINIDFTENHKIAVLYKLNGYKLFIDGVAQNLFGTPTQTVFSGLDNLSFDLRGALSWNASIKEVKIYNTALTDQELQALTT